MDLTMCHPSGPKDFEVDPRFLEELCTPDQNQHITFKKFSFVYSGLLLYHCTSVRCHWLCLQTHLGCKQVDIATDGHCTHVN
jgi:hypothetical protein